jgi:uncharacterized RDD family membrane protein YckC
MSSARQSSLAIETPEGVVFRYELAMPVTRALAWSVDAAAIGMLSMMAAKLSQVFGAVSSDFAGALGVILYFVISVGYGILLEWRWRGQTLGKRVMGLRVVDAQGLRLQLPQIAVRNFLRFVDILPALYLVGGAAAFLSRRCQRLGDLAANTIVARERRWSEPALEQVAPAKYNSLLAYPYLAARLRSTANPEAVGIAVRAVAARDGYDPQARVELFSELAAYFRELVPFPEDALEGLTAEQFVRSVLRVVYGASTRSSPAISRGPERAGRSLALR